MKQKLSIIGGGPAGMILACMLDNSKYDISIFEKNNTLGRKFLVAGKGGFNLTHSEPIDQMIKRYSPSSFLYKALNFFTNKDLVKWLDEINIQTYIGSSKRVFPNKEIKPIFVLKQILNLIINNQVTIHTNMTWNGWNDGGKLVFNKDKIVQSDITIFALGGASWSITGSTGKWLELFSAKGISTKTFEASNGALFLNWEEHFIHKHEGQAIKNIVLFKDNSAYKGELTITKNGIEGSPAYAMNGIVRANLKKHGCAILYLDLKPGLSHKEISRKLKISRKKSWSNHIKQQLKLSDLALSFIRINSSKEEYTNIELLSKLIKKIPLNITSLTDLDEAISTVGGIDLNSVNDYFEIKKLPSNFVIGEMLDWDAPTGGYLLQGCFSMGVYLSAYLNDR